MKLHNPAAVCRVAALLSVVTGCHSGEGGDSRPPPAPDPPRGEMLRAVRIAPGVLEIADPGVLVIRDARTWDRLWRRYAREEIEPPAVDFDREMLVLVAKGSYSACTHGAAYVWRVEQSADSVFVRLAFQGYPATEGESTCMMVVSPVDVVRIPRTPLPVRFAGYREPSPVPPPARWLAPDTAAPATTNGTTAEPERARSDP